MRQYLLPENGNFYKANLHCHSTCSDGKYTPEELKKLYMEHGYSIIAYTDHHVMYNHSYLTDSNFLALTGYEVDISDSRTPWSERKVFHANFISLTPENTLPVFFGCTLGYVEKNAELFPKETAYMKSLEVVRHRYTPEYISETMTKYRNAGYFVTYNHPQWSMEEYPEYSKFDGMHALEIFNYSSYYEGFNDYVPQVYDEMLRAGKRIYCVSTDDNHNARDDSFGGFTVIKADRLDYPTVAKALVDGNFYASMGPEISSLWFEDGEIHIECSEARFIAASTGRRNAKSVWANEGERLTSASFKVSPEDKFIRITVTDSFGKVANTNAYFTDDLFAE